MHCAHRDLLLGFRLVAEKNTYSLRNSLDMARTRHTRGFCFTNMPGTAPTVWQPPTSRSAATAAADRGETAADAVAAAAATTGAVAADAPDAAAADVAAADPPAADAEAVSARPRRGGDRTPSSTSCWSRGRFPPTPRNTAAAPRASSSTLRRRLRSQSTDQRAYACTQEAQERVAGKAIVSGNRRCSACANTGGAGGARALARTLLFVVESRTARRL